MKKWKEKDILIVGAGLSGATIARELAEHNFKITIIDKRAHVAGNAYDFVNSHGIRVHSFGPHIFHTSNKKVIQWLSKFTDWTPYFHRVKAMLDSGQLVTFPINVETRDIVGESNLIDIFYRPYTQKMWGMDLTEIDNTILSRVPIREDLNELYFPEDSFQAMPKNGYEKMVVNILNHENIQVILNKNFEHSMESDFYHIFNSMPIDEYFNYQYEQLPYRSLKFHNFDIPIPRIFPVATVNFTHNAPYTRVTEWKNFPNHGDNTFITSITVEEPCSFEDNNHERYYPIKDKDGKNRSLFNKYKNLQRPNMTFIGRCGMYLYLNMDQAVSTSLSISRKFLQKENFKME